jgi:hypothetical protein
MTKYSMLTCPVAVSCDGLQSPQLVPQNGDIADGDTDWCYILRVLA